MSVTWFGNEDQGQQTNTTFDPLQYTKTQSLNDPKRNVSVTTTPAPTSGAVFGPYTSTVKGPWAGQFNYLGGLQWNGNLGGEQAVEISFFGDSNGRVIPSKLTDVVNAGSPQTYEEAVTEIINSKTGIPGAVTQLKKDLIAKGILSGTAATQSLSQGDAPDKNFQNAIGLAVQLGSAANATLADQGATSFMSFDYWLKNAAPVAGGGTGDGSSTRITYQKFNAEDYDIAIDQLFQQTIGRGASKEELDFFVGRLQNYADLNPQKTVSKVSGGTTTVTTTGGVSGERAASMMREQALLSPGAEEYNKATKYLNYFTQAISSPVQLG